MWISHLSLRNFRNYRHLELSLPQGLVIVSGINAQGKTNCLEALYLLSILKSFKASLERDLVHSQALGRLEAATATAFVEAHNERFKVHVAFQPLAAKPSLRQPGNSVSVQKYVRVNGVPRSISDSVGRLNAVLFSADDLEIILGSPSSRRRFIDVLLCQIDRVYLHNLQRYQRVLTQRNHLLRDNRGERSGLSEELAYWDDQVTSLGAEIVQRRQEIIVILRELAISTHSDLTNGEESGIDYLPSVGQGAIGVEELKEAFRQALKENRKRELAQGVTVVGPHRDELILTVEGEQTATHGSRGQVRSQALALRLAEAEILTKYRGESPVLLLDDVLSEMDHLRREQVLDRACKYQQAIVTTADTGQIGEKFLAAATRFQAIKGSLEPLMLSNSGGK